MMTIDWLPTGESTARTALHLPDVRDVAMAVDLARVFESASDGRSGAARGFAIKDADGALLFSSVDGLDAPVTTVPGDRQRPSGTLCTKQAPDVIQPAFGDDVWQTLGRAAERELLQARGGRETPRVEATDVSPHAPSDSADTRVSVQLPSPAQTCKHRPGVTDLRALAASSPPLEHEAVEASAVARKLGVSRFVAATQPQSPKRRVFADNVDYWVLGTAAALLLVVGSPIYSVYATMSQVKAAEGRVIGNDIDVAHLRGALREEAMPARLAEGRSVAHDRGSVRLVGASSEPDIVAETLGALVRGPAFATVSTGERIDFRKLFWHLRPVSPSRIDVRLCDACEGAGRHTLVFRRSTFWSWKLFDIRMDRDT